MKKKGFYAVLAAVLVMAVILSNFAVPSFARRKLGDVDGDGFITSADARIALRASVKLENLSKEEELAANVDGDGFVTSADARLILRASVKLETLDDVYVEADETTEPVAPVPETTTEPATPDPETTTSVTPDPETTTPVTPDPETTTPVTPDPETTTEPETPTQPDLPDFIPPEKDNEYEILRSGTYSFTGKTVDGSGSSDLEIAKTPNSLYLGAKFNDIKIAVLTIDDNVNDDKDGKVYLVNPKEKRYLDLNTPVMKAEMKALNMDVNEFASTGSFDFSFFPPLEEATRSERVGSYVKYVFEAASGSINVTMYGKKLISLENARDGSVYRIDFTEVTNTVPSEKRELSGLKKTGQTIFITTLFTN